MPFIRDVIMVFEKFSFFGKQEKDVGGSFFTFL